MLSHGLNDFFRFHLHDQMIGFREKVPFKGRTDRVRETEGGDERRRRCLLNKALFVDDLLFFQELGDLNKGEPLGDGDEMALHLPLHQGI